MLDTLVVHPRSAADLVGRDPRATLGLPGKEDAAALFRRRGQVLRLDKSHRQVWTSLAAQDVRGAPPVLVSSCDGRSARRGAAAMSVRQSRVP